MRTLALLLTTIVLNCSSSQSYVSQISGLAPASGTIPPDQARVVILRPDNNRGWTRAEIRISPTALLSLYGGRYLAYDCPPGKFTLKSSAEWSTTALQQMMRSTSTYIPVYTFDYEALPGKTTYLLYDYPGMTADPKTVVMVPRIVAISEAEAQPLMQALRPIAQ